MKKSIKYFERTILFLLKIGLFVCLFFIFFLLLGIESSSILRPSRTAGITMSTFVVLGISLMSVYGGYAIGKQKSKMIIQSLMLATIITDLVTYVQLSIMNTNENNNTIFKFADPKLLVMSMILQMVSIIGFVYFGNYVYFKINPPEKCCIITSSQYSLDKILPKIAKYKMQYKVCEIIDSNCDNIYNLILKYDTVFLYDVEINKRSQLVEFCYQNFKNIYYNLELFDIVAAASKNVLLDDKSMIHFSSKELSVEQKVIKRLMDLTLSIIALVIFLPLMVICAIAIKLDDGGKIFYKQQRATKNGNIFKVLKFRTMYESDEKKPQQSATSGDSRITRTGEILRKFRLDELPQIINIIKGEMSIVGPRPEMLENVYKYSLDLPEFEYRLRAKAGLTGLAQVVGKYNTSPKDKLILDLMYIEKYSLWFDIKLIFQTLMVFLKSGDSTEAFSAQTQVEFIKYEKLIKEEKINISKDE